MKIFKTFLKGLLYVVLSPLIIAGFALYTVYSLFVYLYEFIVATIKFFGGSKLTTETKEDLKVKQIIKEKDEEQELKAKEEEQKVQDVAPIPSETQPQNTTTINNFYITPEQFNLKNTAEPQYLQNNEPKEIENVEVLEIENKEGGNENE